MNNYQLPESRSSAWFAYLLEGFVGILLGLLMLFYPGLTSENVFRYLGLFFMIMSMLTFVTLFHHPKAWFGKLLLALTSLAAGSVIIDHPWLNQVPPELIPIGFSLLAILSGILALVLTLAGEGWPSFWLGILSILFGFSIILEERLNLVNFPYAVAIISIAGGLLLVFFSLARYFKPSPSQKKMEIITPTGEEDAIPTSSDTQPIKVLELASTPAEEHLSSDDFPSTSSVPSTTGEVKPTTGASLAGLEWAVEENETLTPPGESTEPSEWLHDTAAENGNEDVISTETDTEAGFESAATTSPEADNSLSTQKSLPEGAAASTIENAVNEEKEVEPSSESEETPLVEDLSTPTPVTSTPGQEPQSSVLDAPEEAKIDSTREPIVDLAEIQRRLVNSRLEYVEGLGPYYAGRLRDMGIFTCYDLLQQGASRRGRIEIAQKTEVSSRLVLRWINLIDFMRIRGLVSGMVDLLEAAGIDTVAELADRNAENLYTSLLAMNHEKNLVAIAPSLDQVKHWIEQAIALPRVIHY